MVSRWKNDLGLERLIWWADGRMIWVWSDWSGGYMEERFGFGEIDLEGRLKNDLGLEQSSSWRSGKMMKH